MACGFPDSPWVRLGTCIAMIFMVLRGDHGDCV
jgi:hypothetical protein